MNKTIATAEGNVLTLTRVINAPKSKVWAAWTTADIFVQWWGPEGWSTTTTHFDFAPGGYLLYGMTCEDKNQGDWFGKTSWGKSVYETINPEDDFTYVDYFCDEHGKEDTSLPAARVVMNFTEQADGSTLMTSITTYKTEAELQQVLAMGMEAGISQTHDRLEALLSAS